MILSDNTVIPSYLSGSEQGVRWSDPGDQTDIALRYGEVREIVYPDDSKSVTKRFVEYTVEVQHKDGSNPGTSITYPNCVQMGLFGTSADYFQYTLRSDKQRQGKSSLGVGAKVVLMCLNGDVTKGMIIGALRDTGTDKEGTLPRGRDERGDGHNLFFEFNGVQASINADGELQIRYRGATKVNGELTDEADPEAEGSTLTFTKDGSIKLYTKDENQFIHLNHTDKKLEILADTELNINVNGVAALTAGDSINIHTDTGCSIDAQDNILMTSSGVMVGDATDAWLLANKYRNAETRMLKQLSVSLNTLQGLITTAAISLTAAAAANAPPMVGGALAATPFAAAATALNACAPIFSSMSAAIESFEAQSATYLSLKNKND